MARRGHRVVTHRDQRESVARAQEPVAAADGNEDHQRTEDRHRNVPLEAGIVAHDTERHARACVDPAKIGGHQPENLGHHPGSDGEIRAVEPVKQQVAGNGHDGRNHERQRYRQKRIDAEGLGQHEDGISGHADKGLLPHRHQSGIACQHVPHLRGDDVAAQFEHHPDRAGLGPPGHGGERHDDKREQAERDHAGKRLTPHIDHRRGGGLIDCCRDRGHVHALPKRPCGRSASTSRKTIWPDRTPKPGSMRKPIACAMPSTIDPAKAPHTEPMPPMMTASKA